MAQLARDPAFSEDLETLVAQVSAASSTPDVVIDLSGVEMVNSSNLSQLLNLRKKLVDGDAKMRLAGPSNQVWAVFLSTGLDKVFRFTSDTPTALADLQIAPR